MYWKGSLVMRVQSQRKHGRKAVALVMTTVFAFCGLQPGSIAMGAASSSGTSATTQK